MNTWLNEYPRKHFTFSCDQNPIYCDTIELNPIAFNRLKYFYFIGYVWKNTN